MVRLREHACAQHGTREDEAGAGPGARSFFRRRRGTRSRSGAARRTDAASLLPARIRRTATGRRETMRRCTSTTSGEHDNGTEVIHRMDRVDVEPSHWLYQDKSGLQTLLCRTNGATSQSNGPGKLRKRV